MIRANHEPLQPLVWASAALSSGVLLHVGHLPIWAIITVAMCVTWRLLVAAGRLRLPHPIARVGLAVVVVAAVYKQFRTLNGLDAGTVLLVVMGAIKMLEIRRLRDRNIVIGVALFLLLAACLDRQSLLRAPLYLAHAWLCCAALAANSHDGQTLTSRSAIALAGRSLLLAIPLAVVLFIFFPRVAGSFWALPRQSQAVTGLSNTMSPGSISTLVDSDEPAFRVQFLPDIPPPQERYWRGPVLHDFDGYTWSRVPGHFYRQQELQYLGRPYTYRITLEPNANRWWFALDMVTGSPDHRVLFTYDYQLMANEPVNQQITYEAVSHTETRSTEPLSVLARRYDTALPPKRNARTSALARQLRTQHPGDAQYVRAVLSMFRNEGFEYTLTPPLLDYDSVDDFLFNTRKGFCGHYASAFVTLMRAGGIPARVVTGYLGGEWNPIGRFFVVRQSDAHAWAEVWLANRGWTRVDPTAVVAPERLRRGIFDLLDNAGSAPDRLLHGVAWLGRVRQSWEALNAWWDENVVRFDLDTQLDFLRLLGVKEPDWRQLGWAFATGLFLWMTWIAWHVGRRLRSAPPDRLARAYSKLCRKLSHAGLPRELYQGPLAYANAIDARRPDIADAARPLLTRYADLRYGSAADDGSFEREVARLRLPKRSEPFPPEWRTLLERNVPLYRRMPPDLRLRLEPLTHLFLKKIRFVGCGGLTVTEEMRVTIALQACLLISRSGVDAYDELRSVLIYPDEFLVDESDEDEAGVVTSGTQALSGQTFDTARIILSWRDVQESGSTEEAYNVVLHEFAHYLDHSFGAQHAILRREYQALCAAVEEGEPTLIDPYGAEDPAEFFAVATETFFEHPVAMAARHRELYAVLRDSYGVDPARWS